MKQRGTKKNRPKSPTSRARTTPETIDGVRSTGATGSANRGANQGKSRANGDAVSVAQAARMLGVDASTIKRDCASGRLHSFKTTGGHWRIALADIEAVQRRDRNGDNMRRPTTSSPLVHHRREGLEEMRLLIDEKKTQVALEELEDQERQRREQKEAARRAEENEARREQRERDAEQARWDREQEERERQREEFERRQNWVDEQVEFALKSVPPDVAARFASEIQLSVEEALQGLAPSRPKSLVERVVCSAVDRVLQPWAREQQRKQDIATAANEAANPLCVPGLWGNRECEIRAREQALKAILALPESVRFDQMVVVGRAAAQRVVQEYQEQQKQQRNRQEQERAQQTREREVDGYLFNVLPYLLELERAPEPRGVDFEGETFQYAQKIKVDIKPLLLQDPSLNYFTAQQRVRQLVDDWIANSLNERTEMKG